MCVKGASQSIVYFSYASRIWTLFQKIDRMGRVIDLEKNRSKLRIIENEFQNAETKENLRRKEEDEFREMVRKLRMQQLLDAQKIKKVHHIKQDRIIRDEITAIAKEAFGMSVSSTGKARSIVAKGNRPNNA